MSEERAKYLGETEPDGVKYQIRDEAPHDYFCQIPNIVDELDLTPQAYRLYGHLKRVAGEAGKCWQSTKTLSEKCRMSAGSVSEAKKELENTYPPLIRVTSKTKEGGIYHEITVTDVWIINHDYFTGSSVHIVKTPRQRSQCEDPRSQCETKKNPLIQEEPNSAQAPIKIQDQSIEWQIAAGVESVTVPDEKLMRQKDSAALISTGLGTASMSGYELVLAFQKSRGIVFTESQIKGQRRAVKLLLEQNVTPEDVCAAVDKLVAAGMTVTDLYSVQRTAIDLANKPDERYTGAPKPHAL